MTQEQTFTKGLVDDKPLVSGLIDFDEQLTVKEIMQALIVGKKVKLKKAPSGCNFWLENNQIVSDTIGYTKGLPMSWFNPDIHFVVDDG